ncbi:unnamed protein product [Protopolystoma xenopodis]|uniref:Uncharacterized protein n=1 Tax=Protopolystoma xenopodis TaxID=117903 RepID=A0A448XBU3_9PLAT|nr:unnamed protein product [Protopolystoma xenopodis]
MISRRQSPLIAIVHDRTFPNTPVYYEKGRNDTLRLPAANEFTLLQMANETKNKQVQNCLDQKFQSECRNHILRRLTAPQVPTSMYKENDMVKSHIREILVHRHRNLLRNVMKDDAEKYKKEMREKTGLIPLFKNLDTRGQEEE